MMIFIASCNSFYFYIKPQRIPLHLIPDVRCNSFYFYIKPQPMNSAGEIHTVVIHSISTSNHNQMQNIGMQPVL